METITIGKSITNHATRDGVHPVCRPAKVGQPTKPGSVNAPGTVTCYSCRPIVEGYKR